MKKILIACLALFSLSVSVAFAKTPTEDISPYPMGERSVFSDRAVTQRIKPVGSVCVEGEKCAQTASADNSGGSSSGPRSGKTIFDAHCTACHSSGAMGAPKVGSKADWGPRIKKGIDTLLSHAENGFNAMPPKGLCSDCSKQELKNAIEYMISKSK